MSIDNESISILVDLGLSVLQAKIYLTLLTQKSGTAQTISNLSKVSRPDVYRIIDQLEELKIVERIIGNPTNFQAIPLEACTSILMQNKIEKLSEIKKRIPILIKHIGERTHEKQMDPKNEFTLISKEAVFIRSKKMLMDAKKSFFSVIPTEKLAISTADYKVYTEEALSRNVDCRVIICYPVHERLGIDLFKRADLFKNYKVRFVRNKPLTAMAIIDREEVLINTQIGENFEASALLSCNKSIVNLCESYFQSLWNEGFFKP